MHEQIQFRRGLAVVAVVVLLVLAGCAGSGGEDVGASPTAAPGDGPDGQGGDTGQAQSIYRDGNRVVVRSASMEVRVKQFEKQFREARRVARTQGGFVTDYNIESVGDWQRATFTVRVPAGNFSATRDALADLGSLESESVRAHDFTNEYREREGELAKLRERERNLEEELANTDDTARREDLRKELRAVRDRIDELEAKQNALDRRATLSTIRVTMHEPVGQKPPDNYRSSFGFGDALLGGIYGGLGVLKAVVLVAGYLVSIALSLLVLGLLGMVFLAGAIATGRHVWPRIREAFRLGRGARLPDRPADDGSRGDPSGRDEPLHERAHGDGDDDADRETEADGDGAEH